MSDYIHVDPTAARRANPDEDTTWGDYGRSMGKTIAGIGSSAAAIGSWYADKVGDSDTAQEFAIRSSQMNDAGDRIVDGMTEAGKRSLRSDVLGSDFWEHPFRAIALKGVGMAPYVVALSLPSGIVGAALGEVAGMVTAGSIGAGLSAGDLIQGVAEKVDAASDDSLRGQSSYYAGLRERLEEGEARRQFRNYLVEGDGRLAMAALAGGLEGFVGLGGMAARASAGKGMVLGATNRGFLGRVGMGALGEGATETVQEGTANATQQFAEIEGGFRKEFNPREWWAQTLEGMGLGALSGGAFGAFHTDHVNHKPNAKPSVTSTTGPGAAISQALGESLNTASPPVTPPVTQGVTQPTPPTPPPVPPQGVTNSVMNQQSAQPPAPPPTTAAPPLSQGAQDAAAKVMGQEAAPTEPTPPVGSQTLPGGSTEQTTPETPKSLAAQVTELADGVSPFVFIPKGTRRAPSLPTGSNFRVETIPKVGRIYYDRTKLTVAQIRDAVANDRINDLGKYAETSKADALADVDAGATPLAVVRENADGTPVVEAASSSETAESDAAQIAAQGRETDTTKIVPPEAVQRGRVLEDVSAEGQARQEEIAKGQEATVKRVADAEKEAEKKRLQEESAQKVKDETGGIGAEALLTKDKVRAEKRAQDERVAKEITDAHPATETVEDLSGPKKNITMQSIFNRAEAMLKKAEVEGVAVPKNDNKHSNELMILRRAQQLLKAAGSKGLASVGSFKKFLEVEAVLRSDKDLAIKTRRGEKDEAATAANTNGGVEAADAATTERQGTLSEASAQDAMSPEEKLIAAQESGEESDGVRDPNEVWAEGRDRDWKPTISPEGQAKLDKVKKLVEKGATEGERNAAKNAIDRVEAAINAPRYTAVTAPKAAVVVQVAKRRNIAIPGKAPASVTPKSKAEAKAPEPTITRSDDVAPSMSPDKAPLLKQSDTQATDRPMRTTTLSEIFDETKAWASFGNVSPLAKLIQQLFRRRIKQLVGKMQVHIATDNSPLLLTKDGKWMNGYYDPKTDYVVLSQSAATSPEIGTHVVMHEALHAAFYSAIRSDPKIAAAIDAMRNAVRQHLTLMGVDLKDVYGVKNKDEFISEAFSNEKFQELLASVELTPQSRAEIERAFGATPERTAPRRIWEMFLGLVRRALHLPPNSYTALDAAIRAGRALDAIASKGRGTSLDSTIQPSIAKVTQGVKDAVQSPDWKTPFRSARFATDTMTMLAQRASKYGEKFGTIADQLDAAVKKMSVFKNDWMMRKDGVVEITKEGEDLRRQYGDQAFSEATDLGFGASEAGVSLHRAGEANPNNFGSKITKLASLQAKDRYKDLQAKFEQLPPPLQDWLIKSARFGKKERDTAVRAYVQSMLERTGVNTAGLTDRILRGQMTDIDQRLFNTKQVPDHLKRVAKEAMKPGWYFAFNREGDIVVNGNYELKVNQTPSITKISDDTVQFVDPKGKRGIRAARRAAEAFAAREKNLTMTDASMVYVDRNNPTKLLDKTDIDSMPAVRLTFQTQFTSMHNSESEANTAAEELRKNGLNNVSVELKRLNPNGFWGGLMASQFEDVINSMQANKSFQKLTKGQQDLTILGMREAAVRLLPGSRFQHHKLKRQNVAGYSKDLIESMGKYGAQSAGYLAKVQDQPAIDAKMKELHDEAKANNDGNTIRRQEIARELENRVYNPQIIGNETETGWDRIVRRVNQVSQINKLAGPSFHLINSAEPWMVSAPVMAGRHGITSTLARLKGAYRLIGAGSGAMSGVRDIAKAWSQNDGFTDYRRMFQAEISRNAKAPGEAARLNSVLDYLYDRELLGLEAGMELQRRITPSDNAAGRALDRGDLMARQVGQAIEAINRSIAGLSAYQLEYQRTNNHEASLKYAHDIVHDTMGNYSAGNAAPIFNSKFGRMTLQFKKFPQRTYYLLGKIMGSAIRGDREAMKQFAGLMFTHGLMAGAAGLPLEPIKIAFIAAGMLGAGFSWDDMEDLVRSALARATNAQVSEAVMKGVPRAFGIDLSGRMGLDSLLTFSAPKNSEQASLKSWLFDTVAGAPIGTALGTVESAKKALSGDFLDAAEKAPIPKFGVDVVRAIKGVVTGKESKAGRQTMEPYNAREAVTRALGFTPAREANEREMRSAFYGREKDYKEARNAITKSWIKATPDQRAKMWGKVEAWNKTLDKDQRLTRADLDKSAKRRTEEDSAYGIVSNKRNKTTIDAARREYGVN